MRRSWHTELVRERDEQVNQIVALRDDVMQVGERLRSSEAEKLELEVGTTQAPTLLVWADGQELYASWITLYFPTREVVVSRRAGDFVFASYPAKGCCRAVLPPV